MNLATPFTDADFRRTMLSALRLLTILAVILAALVGWKLGWQSAALLIIGAAISGAGLWDWLRLMTAVMVHMDAASDAEATKKVRPLGMLLVNFFLRLGLTVAVLYVSLKLLHGSVYALAGGLVLGVFALSVEGIRLMKAWTV
jgi:hypothetical protein